MKPGQKPDTVPKIFDLSLKLRLLEATRSVLPLVHTLPSFEVISLTSHGQRPSFRYGRFLPDGSEHRRLAGLVQTPDGLLEAPEGDGKAFAGGRYGRVAVPAQSHDLGLNYGGK